LARIYYKLSLRNAIINRKAREMEWQDANPSSEPHGKPSTNKASLASQDPPAVPSSALSNPLKVIRIVLSPISRLLKWGRLAFLAPVLRQLYPFREHTEILFSAVHDVLYALHEKVDAVHHKMDASYDKIDELRQKLDEVHAETRLQLDLITEFAQATHTKVEETALRVRVPLQIDEFTFSLRTYDGFVLVPRSDPLLLLMLLDAGPQGLEPGTRTVLTKLLVPGMTFVDVGAHIGLHTLAGARAVGAKGTVMAIEPNPATFDLLNRAISVNGLPAPIITKRVAVGEYRESSPFYVRNVVGHSSLYLKRNVSSDEATTIEVDVWPLDELVPAGERVDVIKIDVEGAELKALRGMSRIVRENPDIAIIAEFGRRHLEDTGTSPEQWFGAFRSDGFDAYSIDEITGECGLIDGNAVTAVESVNILFVRPSSLAMSRVF
jgi:FkbM family methyltransferase